MDPTKDLDLGAEDYTGESSDEELFGGFNSSKPYHDLYQHPMHFGKVDPTELPVQDPVQHDPQQFEDFKMLEGELSALSSDAAGLGRVRREKEGALDQFMTDTMTPFYKDTLGMGMLDAEKSDFDDHDTLFKRFDDHFNVLDAQSKETGMFGGENKEAIAGMTHFPKYQQIKQKYGRLKTDLDRFSGAEQNAVNRKNALTQAKYSLPETFRRAADNYKAETGGAKLSDKAFNELLDQQDFEEPIHGVNGLLNEDKLDPRIPYDGGYSATAGDLSEPVNKRNQAKLNATKKISAKAFQNTMALSRRDEGLRSQGVNFSEFGQFAGYPLYMNQGERAILNLEKAQKAGATTWKGVPIEQAFESAGGQDKLIASKMVETVFNAHNMVQNAAVDYWRDQTPDKKEKWELAKKVREEAWVQAAKMGLGNEIPDRGDTVGFWAGLGNAFKRGDLQEDLSDFTPALLGAIDVDTAQQIIDVMEETDELQTTSAYKAIKATKSDGFLEAMGKIFSNGSAIPEMVAETLTAFFSAWFTEGARVVPAFAAGGAAKGALFGSAAGPKGTLLGAGGGAVGGATLGVKASVPIASFVLEYAGEVLNELDKLGVDWRNPHIFVAAWNNPKIRAKIRKKAAKYAGGIAMIDAVAMGVVGRTHKAVSTKNIKSAVSVKAARDSAGSVTRKSNIAGMAAEVGVQSGLGMSGEALGQIWSRDPGDPLIRDWDALAAEGVIEFAGPSGAAFVAQAMSSKAHTWQNDLGGVEETILLEHEGRKSVEGDAQTTTVQQVDKGGYHFERKFFPNAQLARQELAASGVDFNTTSGRILGFLLDMLGGRIRTMGFVFSDRSPMSHNTKGAYDQLTGTVFINKNLSKDHAFTILHEASHFIEQMYGINVKELYDQLTPEEKENHWASYLQEGEAKFSSLSGWQRTMYNGVPFFRKFGEKDSARARSEWFAHQVVRVLTGMDQGVDPQIKQSVDDFLSKFESSEDAKQFVGSSEGQNTRDLLASVLLQVMGVDQDGIYADPDRWYNANFGTTEQQSDLAPSINLNQDFKSFTKYEKDVLAIFLGAYQGWDSLSRSNKNSIAQAFAGADLTNPNIQLDGTDALARLTNRQLQKETKTQTVPGVDPRLKGRRGRGRRSNLLGSSGQVDPFTPSNINEPESKPGSSLSDKSVKAAGAFSGRLEEEEGDPFSDYEQTLASIELDRQRTDEDLDYSEQQADETAQEENELQREAEIKEAEEAETLYQQADETAQEENELQREAEIKEAEEADQIEEEYDFLYEEYGMLGSQKAASLIVQAKKIALAISRGLLKEDTDFYALASKYGGTVLGRGRNGVVIGIGGLAVKGFSNPTQAKLEANSLNRVKGIEGFQQIVDSGRGFLISKIVKGNPLGKTRGEAKGNATNRSSELTAESIKSVKDSHWDSLAKSLAQGARRGITLDTSDPGNLLYDKTNGFTIIDPVSKPKNQREGFIQSKDRAAEMTFAVTGFEAKPSTQSFTKAKLVNSFNKVSDPELSKKDQQMVAEADAAYGKIIAKIQKRNAKHFKEYFEKKDRLNKTSNEEGIKITLGSQSERSNAVAYYTNLLFKARATDKGKPFSATDPDRTLNQQEVYSTHFWRWNDSLIRRDIDDKARYKWFNKYHPDKFFEYYPAKTKQAPIDDAFTEYLDLRGPEKAPDKQQEFLLLGSGTEQKILDQALSLLGLTATTRKEAQTSLIKSIKAYTDTLSDRDRKIAKRNPLIIMRGILGMNRKNSIAPKSTSLVDEDKFILKRRLKAGVKKGIGFKNNYGEEGGKSLKDISGSGPVKSRYPRLSRSWGAFIPGEKGKVVFKDFVNLSLEEREKAIIANRELYEKGRQGSDIPFTITEVDDAVEAYVESKQLAKLSAQAPNIETVVPYGVHLVDSTKGEFVNLTAGEAELTRNIGKVGDYVNFRMANIVPNAKTKQEEALKNDPQNGGPIQRPDDVYAYEITDYDYDYEDGVIVYQYDLRKVTKKEATKSLPWTEIPLSRIFDMSRGNEYYLSQEQREMWGDHQFSGKDPVTGEYGVRSQYLTVGQAMRSKKWQNMGLQLNMGRDGKVEKNKLGKINRQGLALQTLAKLTGMGINRNGKIERFQQGPLFKFANPTDRSASEARDDAIDSTDARIALNMVFAAINNTQDLTKSDLIKAQGVQKAQLMGKKDSFANPINWENTQILNPNYEPVNMMAALFARVLDQLQRANVNPKIAARSLVDFQLLDLMGVAKWVDGIPDLEYFLHPEAKAVGTEALFTALKRRIVLARQDPHTIGTSTDGNIIKNLEEADPEWGKEFGGLEPSESLKNSEKVFLPSKYILRRKYFPAKSDPKGGKTYYPSGTKTTTERGKFEFFIEEIEDPNIDELGPVWELIDGQLTFVYEGRVVSKIERAVDGTTYVQLEGGPRRIKISKIHKEEYDADELSIHAAFHKVNPDTIGVLDSPTREYPPQLRVEASHSRHLREKKDTDYQEGRDPVELVYVTPRKNETRTQAVNRAEKAGRGISVFRKKGDKHYGNPFSDSAISKADYNVGSRGNAIHLFALWLAAGDVKLYNALVYKGELPESFASPESQKRVGVSFKVEKSNLTKALSNIDPLFEPKITSARADEFYVEVVLKSELSSQYAEREKAFKEYEKSLRAGGAYYISKSPVDTGKKKFLGVEEDTTGKPIISEEEGLPIDFSYKDVNGHWDEMLISNVEPKRRAWILKQIESGALDGKRLLYGIDTDAHRQDNHAEVLRELINSKRPQRDAEQWEIDWALGKDKEEGHYNYRYQLIKSTTPKQVRMMGKMTSPLTQEQQEQLEALLDDFNPTLFGESGKQNIHDKPIFNSEDDNPLSVANKTELGLISTGRPQSKNKRGKESLGGVADGLGQAFKWADFLLLSYLDSHPDVSNPEAELANLTSRYGSQWSSLTGTNYFKGKSRGGKPSKRKSYYADGDVGRKRAEFIYNSKLLLIRKLVANSVGLTERFGESIETPVAEDTSVESIKDSENLGSILTTDDDSADTSAKGRDQAKEVRSELIDTKDESSLTPAELMEIEEGNTGVDESPQGAAARLKREEAAQAYEEAMFKNVFVIDDDVISKLADQSPMFAEQDKLAKAEKLSKENEKKVNTFVDKALEKSVRQGWDAEAVQRISAQLLKTKLYDNIEIAQDKVRERAGKFIESAKSDPKTLKKDRVKKLALQRVLGEAPPEDPGAQQDPDNKNPWKKNPKTGKWEQRKPSKQTDATPAQQGWIQKTENLEEQFENLLRGVRDEGIAKKLERLDNLPEEQKKQFQFAFEAMMEELADKGMLGSNFLTSELQNTFFEKLKWMVMGLSQGGYDKLPESVQGLVYGFRLKIFSQFISYEDLHMRIIHALRLQDGSKAKDFFDLQGHIIRNFATVKAASDYWRTALRDPILEYLKEYGVTPEEWGAYSIAIGTGLQNRYLESKHKRALEKQESALYGPLIWDAEKKQQVRDTKLGAEDKLRKQKEYVEKLKAGDKPDPKVMKREKARLSEAKTTEATLKKKIKALDLSAYFIDGEFAGAGMTSQEALDTYKSIKSEERFKKLLAETDIQQKFAQLNLQTITILATSGLLDAGQAFRMYITHYRPPEASNEKEAYNIALKNLQDLGIDFENTDIPVTWEDLGKDQDGIKLKQWWKKHYEKSQTEISQGLPQGYWYSPMTGFKDVEGFFQTQDEMDSIMGTGPKSGGRGAGRGVEPSRTNRLFQFSKGRKAGTAPPDPKAVLAFAFAAAENAVIRVAKKPSSEHVINLYALYEVLHQHQDNFAGLVGKYKDHKEDMFGGILPESQGNLIDAWDMGPIFESKHALKDLFEELDKVFDPMEYDTEKGHPIEEEVVFEEQEVDGVKRLELVHRIRRIDDNDTSLFIDRRNGQRVYAKFKENVQGKRFNAELKNIGYQPLWWLLHNNYFSINTLTRLMAMSFTSWNPDFVLTNQVRDAFNARLNMSESKNKEFYREFKKGYIKKLFKANAGILKAETKIESWRKWNKMSAVQKRKRIQELGIPDDLEGMKKKYGFDNLNSEGWQAWWLWLEQKGLRTSFIRLDSASDIMRQIDADFKGLTGATAWTKLKGSRGVQFVKNFGENVVDPLNTMIENSTRIVVAVEALKAGMTEHQAVKLGRNVSVDFNRKGTMSSGIGALVVFFNAGVQGNLRFARSLIMRGPKDAAKIVAGIAGFSFLWAWLQMLLSGEEDEENFSHYDQLSDVKKNTNLIAFIPGTKTHMSLPLPYGWNWIWAFGQIAAQRSARSLDYGGQGVGTMEGIGNLTENFHRQFSPIGGAPDVAGVPIPTFMAPFVEISKNENFFGAPIEKVKFPFDPPKPAAYMSRKGTAAFWKDFSILVNSASGGDEVTPGSLKRLFGDNSLYNSPENDVEWAISGSAMEHVFNSFTGGFGASFARTISGGVSAMKGDFEPNFDEIPVVRRFVRTDYSNYKTLERFFSLRDRANMADRYVKMAKKGAMPPKEAREMMRLNRNLINIKGLIDAADTSRKALKRKADAIEQSNMPASEKRDKLEEIEKQTMANYRKVLLKATKLNIEV